MGRSGGGPARTPGAGLVGAMSPPAAPAALEPSAPLSAKPILLMLGSCFCFAWMALTVGAANERAPELHVATASLFRAGTNLLAVVLIGRLQWRTLVGDGRLALWTRGIWGSISLLSFFGALSLLDVGQGAFLNYTSAFWVAALGPIVLKERTRPLVWLAVAGSMVGVLLLSSSPHTGAGLGHALGLASGFFAALAYLSVRRAASTNGPVAVVFYFTLIATVICAVWALALDLPLPTDPPTIGLLVASGLCATAGQLLMTRAYQLGQAAPVAAAGAFGPLLTTLFGFLVLHQAPEGRQLLGMGVLFVSAVLLPILAQRGADPRK